MKQFLLAILVIYSVSALHVHSDDLSSEFYKFVKHHEKNYDTESEFNFRLDVFKANFVKMMNMHVNNLSEVKEVVYSPFMDLTEEEFSQKLGFKQNIELTSELKANAEPLRYRFNLGQEVPDQYNWAEQGVVTGVKNQGSCGSCWAFSTTGQLEGQTKLTNGELLSLSEQELVDCDKVDQGCNGGLMEQAYDEIKRIGGLETEEDYSYKGTGGTCKYDASKKSVKVKSYSFVDKNEDLIKEALFHSGPLAVALNASTLQFYFGGIAHPFKVLCNPSALNHGVLLVGYGSENGKNYWIVKNSWGKSWGEKGYFRMYRGDGTCGINTHVLSAEIEKN